MFYILKECESQTNSIIRKYHSPSWQRLVKNHIFKIFVLVGWGMTETSPVGTVVPYKNPKQGSVGILIPNTESQVKITWNCWNTEQQSMHIRKMSQKLVFNLCNCNEKRIKCFQWVVCSTNHCPEILSISKIFNCFFF